MSIPVVSPGAALWLRIVTATALALGLLVVLTPERPRSWLPWPVGALLGAVAGTLLFLVAIRSRPRLPARPGAVPVLLARYALFGVWAANEEILWRRVVLGSLLPVGAFVALVTSAAGFALAHRARRRLQLGTGAAFGGVYLGTGTLVASITAHWLYNVLAAGLLRPVPRSGTSAGGMSTRGMSSDAISSGGMSSRSAAP